jgi:ABC-type uncharacterized transport system substrate-binding protein
MWIDANLQMQFDDKGRVASVSQSWTFDELFSSYAIQGIKRDTHKMPDQEALDAIAQNWMGALADPMSHYFTDIEQDNRALKVSPAEAITARWDLATERLVLQFSLPLVTPVSPQAGPVSVRVADPTYFVAYSFDPRKISAFNPMPEGCQMRYHATQQLDPFTANRLASIPAAQAEPPPELLEITRRLQHRVELKCHP